VSLPFAPDSILCFRSDSDAPTFDGTLAQCDRTTDSRVIPQLRGHNIVVDGVAKQRGGYHVPVEYKLNALPNGSEQCVLA
jgi:hypothetical protein